MIDVIASIQENGNLKLSVADAEAKEDLREACEFSEIAALVDALEHYWTNGSFHPFDAGDANPFVGLTNALCIAESLDFHDDGTREIVGRFWYFSNYMLESPIESLIENGFVVFDLAE